MLFEYLNGRQTYEKNGKSGNANHFSFANIL